MCASTSNKEDAIIATDYVASSDVTTDATDKGSTKKIPKKAAALLGDGEDDGRDIGLQTKKGATGWKLKYLAVLMLVAVALDCSILYFRSANMQLTSSSSNNMNATSSSSEIEEGAAYAAAATDPDDNIDDESITAINETNSTNTTTTDSSGGDSSTSVTSSARSSVASAVTSSAAKTMTTYTYGGGSWGWGGGGKNWGWNANYNNYRTSRSSSSDYWYGKKNKKNNYWNRKWGYGSSSSDYNNWWWGGNCFPAGEMVDLIEESATPIEDVKPGDVAIGGGKVKAIMKLLFVPEMSNDEGTAIGETMYRYNGSTCVTGSHAIPVVVNKSLTLQRVKESALAKEDKDGKECGHPDFLYNLVTEHHVLTINGTVLADYDEADTLVELEMNHLRRLNGEIVHDNEEDTTDPSGKAKVGQGAFMPGTLVDVIVPQKQNGQPIQTVSKRIEDIEPGEMLSMDCGVVLARVTLLHDNCENTLMKYGNTIVNPWAVVRDVVAPESSSFVWRHVKDSPLMTNLSVNWEDTQQSSSSSSNNNNLRMTNQSSNSCIMHQLITSTHRIPISGGIIFADYEVADGSIA